MNYFELYMSLILNHLVVADMVITKNIDMHDLVTKFRKNLEITKQHAGNLVNEKGMSIYREQTGRRI